jgi:iron complex outermembrane receptor protein
MKTKIYSFLLMLLFTVSGFAQSYEVVGTVSDSDNQPLPGVSVSVKGTTEGTPQILMENIRSKLIMEMY